MDLAKYHKIFTQESERYLDELEDLLLRLEGDSANLVLWTDIHGKFHSIKSMSKALSFDNITKLSHRIENWCKQFQEGTATPEPGVVQLFFDAKDLLKLLVAGKGCLDSVPDQERYDRILSKFLKDPGETMDFPSDGESQEPIQARHRRAETAINYVRVKYSLIEELLGLSQEILLLEKTLPPLSDEQISLGLKGWIDDYRSVLKGLHFRLVQLRLMSVGDFAHAFIRSIRDIARENKKDIQWEIDGGELEADITLLERLREPFIHVLRNSIVHGIETSDDRQKMGKNPVGTIRLVARRERDTLTIRLTDDGKGIDRSKIYRFLKATRGLSDREIEGMPEDEFLETILDTEFSSVTTTTDMAGRGIGMNLVAQTIEYLGGRMQIRSEDGKGAEFIFHLPVFLSIVYTLVFRIDDFSFSIPTSNLVSIDQASDTVENASEPYFNIRGLLDLPDKKEASPYILTLKHTEVQGDPGKRGGRLKMAVDGIIGNKPVMVMPIGELMAKNRFFSGVGILESGDISILLDISSFPDTTA